MKQKRYDELRENFYTLLHFLGSEKLEPLRRLLFDASQQGCQLLNPAQVAQMNLETEKEIERLFDEAFEKIKI